LGFSPQSSVRSRASAQRLFALKPYYELRAKLSRQIMKLPPKNILSIIGKIILATIVIVDLIFLAKFFHIQEYLRDALQWIDSLGNTGVIAFMVIYIFATVLFIPGSLLTLGAGVIFQVVLGSVCVFVAATLGATGAFLVGRYLARGWVEKQIAGNEKFQAIDKAVAREGLKIVLLTRLSPVFPFNLLNYAFGLTQVSLKDYFLGSVGMIPGTIMYVYIGSLAGDLATIGTPGQATAPEALTWAIKIIGGVAALAVTLYVTKIAKNALEMEITSENNDE